MWNAIPAGKVDAIRKMLESGTDVNARDADGWTALFHAAEHGQVEILRLLIDWGADVNLPLSPDAAHTSEDGDEENDDSITQSYAMPFALRSDADRRVIGEMVTCLLQAGADVDVCDEDGITPLMLCAGFEYLELVQSLIDAGADVNLVDREGMTALHHALRVAEDRAVVQAIVDALLAAGADPNARDQEGNSAVYHAMQKGHLETAAYLRTLVHAQENAQEYTDALLPSVEQGDAQRVRQCIAGGADVNIRGKAGITPLILAAREGIDEIVGLLLAAGADVNARTEDGYSGNHTPLRCAVARSHASIVKQLLEAGADTSPVYEYSSIPAEQRNTVVPSYGATLHDAVRTGSNEVVRMLLDAGTDVNVVDSWDETPLVAAIKSRQWETADAPPENDGTSEGWAKHFAFGHELDQRRWKIIDTAYDDCFARGHLLINPSMPFLGGDKRFLYLYPTNDKYAVMASIGVQGNEVELSTNDIISWMREFEKDYGWRLIGCSFDKVEFDFLELPKDVPETARRLYEFCPDLIDQGFETMARLIDYLTTNHRVHLWWD